MEVKIFLVAQEFIDDLDERTSTKVYKCIKLLKEFGKKLGPPYSKKVGDDLYELRGLGKINVRLLYCFENNFAWILHGFIKKTNKIPKKELVLAEKRKHNLRSDN